MTDIYYHRLGSQDTDIEATDTDVEDSACLQKTDQPMEKGRNKHLLNIMIALEEVGLHRALQKN